MAAPKGNKNASLGTLVRDAMRKAALSGNPKRLQKVVEKVFDEAEAGNMQAAGLIFDRLDGKAPQPIANDGEGGFIIQVIR